MSDLLTRAEYAAIASALDFPRTAFIDGKFRAGTGEAFDTINPATGETLVIATTAVEAFLPEQSDHWTLSET